MAIQPISNTKVLSYAETTTNNISRGITWFLAGAVSLAVIKSADALVPEEYKQTADVVAKVVFGTGVVGALYQASKCILDVANPAVDPMANYVKVVVKPIVDGVEFVGTIAATAITDVWSSAMKAMGYGAKPAAAPVVSVAPVATKTAVKGWLY